MHHYRIIPLLISMLAATGMADAQAVLRASPSGRGLSEVTLALPETAPAAAGRPAAAPAADTARPLVIRLDFGQPHLRGRTLHTDSLVPYDKPWRTGANQPTTLTTDVDLVLGGATLAKGTYLLYTLPGKAAWKLVVQRNIPPTGPTYDDRNDVARIDLRHTALAAPVESFTMWLIPSLAAGPARGELRFAWGTDQLTTTWSVK